MNKKSRFFRAWAHVRANVKQIVLMLLIFGILLTFLIGPMALAQSSACGDYTCPDQSNFDTNADGWTKSELVPDNYTDVTWLASKTFGMLWWASTEEGVLSMETAQLGSSAGIWKSVFLQPGNYRVIFRGGVDRTWSFNKAVETHLYASPTLETRGDLIGTFTLHDRFDTFVSDSFSVDAPREVSLLFEGGEDRTIWYFSYIWLVEDTTPTATPGAGTPTVTPVPPNATPVPTATPYCITPEATATPAPPEFALTPAPSPTPNPNLWSVLDKFDYYALAEQTVWRVAGSGVRIVQNNGRASAGRGSVFIPYSVDPPEWDYTDMLRTALIFVPAAPLAGTVYVDGWIQADFVPVGESSQIEIWLLDGSSMLWSQAETDQASMQYWYNFHKSVSSAGGIVAIAFLSSRSDAGNGGLYLDDVYMYGDLSMAPRCDGSYPAGTTLGSGLLPPSSPGGGWAPINWPANKPCPPDIKVPNNFWGPLLAQITVFLDEMFAMTPAHQSGSLVEATRIFIASPVSIYLGITATFFNLRIPILVMLIVIALDIGSFIRGVWMVIKDSIPFL